jgi:adenylylsulfate kinase
MSSASNLHPIFDRLVARAEKEARLKQKARVIWLYGLSGSGKSTLALALERKLHEEGRTTELLDGDNVRTGLNKNLGFSDADRDENIRRVAEVAKLFVNAGIITICSFITPARRQRELAQTIVGADDFLGVFVRASFETCAARDPKGLYAKAKAGNLAQFTGKDSSFEPPEASERSYVLDTETESAAASLERLCGWVKPAIQFS